MQLRHLQQLADNHQSCCRNAEKLKPSNGAQGKQRSGNGDLLDRHDQWYSEKGEEQNANSAHQGSLVHLRKPDSNQLTRGDQSLTETKVQKIKAIFQCWL